MRPQIADIKKAVEGKQIVSIEIDPQPDEGLILKLADGTILSWGYSSMEGFTELNGKQADI